MKWLKKLFGKNTTLNLGFTAHFEFATPNNGRAKITHKNVRTVNMFEMKVINSKFGGVYPESVCHHITLIDGTEIYYRDCNEQRLLSVKKESNNAS